MKRIQTSRVMRSWNPGEIKGYTHVLYNKFGADFVRSQENEGYQPQDWTSLSQLVNALSVEQNFGSAYYLYSLSP